jgi:hypothetical protein
MLRFGRYGALAGALTLLMGVAIPASAQGRSPSKVGGFAGFEIVHSTEDEGSLGMGPGILGGVTYQLTSATALAAEIGAQWHERNFTFLTAVPGQIQPLPYEVRWSGRAVFLLATVRHAFGQGRTRPFVYGGGGLMHDNGTTSRITDRSQLPASVSLPNHDFQSPTATVGALDGGAGVQVELRSGLSVRPFGGLRLTAAGETGPKYIIRGGVAVGW